MGMGVLVEGPPASRIWIRIEPSDSGLRASEEAHPASSRLNDVKQTEKSNAPRKTQYQAE